MADLIPEGERVSELGATFRGGATLVLRNQRDFDFMEFACSFVEQSSEPLHLLYGLLHTPGFTGATPPTHSALDYDTKGDRPIDDIRAMKAALEIARTMWQSNREECSVTCSLPRPGADRPFQIEHEGSALILQKGSVRPTLSLGSIRAAGFALSFFTGRGFTRSQSVERLLEDSRSKAMRQPNAELLDRLDNQPRKAYDGKSAVFVFLHGLLSTDIGLFDRLIRVIKQTPELSNCALVGWPHDTMSSIDSNSTVLRGLIDQVISVDGPPVLFVAHSRGGLLARSAAVKLYDKSQKWQTQLRGCVTFGTPHAGCPLAESPGDLLGKVICIQALRNTGHWLSLVDALSYTHQSRDLRGIEDLRPISGGGDFIKNLLDDESRYAPDGMERLLDIAAVGGITRGSGLSRLLANRALADSRHDLVVESRSSIPPLFINRYTTDCDHFGYFGEDEMKKHHIEEVVGFCSKRISPPKIGQPFTSRRNIQRLRALKDPSQGI